MANPSKYINHYSKNTLLTGDINKLRNDVRVVYQYPAPRISKNLIEYYSKSLTYEEFWRKSTSNVLGKRDFNKSDNLVLMDKITPHAILDLMLIDGSLREHLFINDYSKRKKLFILRLITYFLKYSNKRKLYPYIAFNYEPYTRDRESVQSTNRFHIHLIARKYKELNKAIKNVKKVIDLDEITRRRVADESTYLFTNVAYEIVNRTTGLDALKPLKPFSKKSPFPGLLFKIRDFSLPTNKFFDEIELLKEIYIQIFKNIHNRFFSGQTGVWIRPLKIPDERVKIIAREISQDYLFNQETQDLLVHFYNSFFNLNQNDIEFLKKDRKESVYMIPLAGPCINFAIFKRDNEYFLYTRSQLFSDLGGAGLQIYEDTILKIKRNMYSITNKEIKDRKRFQSDIAKLFLSLKDFS